MSKNKSIILIVIVLLVALFASSIVYDIFTHDIENKELNLSIAEKDMEHIKMTATITKSINANMKEEEPI